MKKLSQQLMSLFALVMLVLGWTGWGILKKMYPEEIFNWYPYIPCVFFLVGILMIIILAKNYKKEAKKLVNIYMILKLVKLVMAMVYLLAFYFIVRVDIRIFGIVFAAYYGIYIGLETGIFYLIEKQIKKEA
ncbi:MAG TPA: hypothetical protein VI413_02955 [Paludibacter sp.]|jgi:drug/metabolite transporter (DMT)-like permease